MGCNSTVLPDTTDGTTDSCQDDSCSSTLTGLNQFFNWKATTLALVWDSQSPGFPGIVIFDETCSMEIDCRSTSNNGPLSGWAVSDSLFIQIYNSAFSVSDVAFCLKESTQPTIDTCDGAIAETFIQALATVCNNSTETTLAFITGGTTDSG